MRMAAASATLPARTQAPAKARVRKGLNGMTRVGGSTFCQALTSFQLMRRCPAAWGKWYWRLASPSLAKPFASPSEKMNSTQLLMASSKSSMHGTRRSHSVKKLTMCTNTNWYLFSKAPEISCCFKSIPFRLWRRSALFSCGLPIYWEYQLGCQLYDNRRCWA